MGRGPGVLFLADWSRPSEFAARIAAHAHEKPQLLVAWTHSPWRQPALGTHLAGVSCARAELSRELPVSTLPSSRRVVLGSKRTG